MSGRHAAGAAEDETGSADLLDGSPDAPLLRVVAGHPTTDELAAVTALLAAVEAARVASAAAVPARSPGSAWTRSARAPRAAVESGDGRWRGFSG